MDDNILRDTFKTLAKAMSECDDMAGINFLLHAMIHLNYPFRW